MVSIEILRQQELNLADNKKVSVVALFWLSSVFVISASASKPKLMSLK